MRTLNLMMFALVLACATGAGAVEKITVLGLFKDKALVEIDGKRRLLHAGEPSPEGVKLISADSEQAILEVDGQRATYHLGSHIGSNFAAPESPTVRIWPTTNKMYEVIGSINGYPVKFLVDTGATFISMNANEARRLGIDYRIVGEEAVSSTASGYAKIYLLQLARVRVGDIQLRNVNAAVHDGDFPEVALLGMSFLSRLDMNREGDVLELRKKF